ncbi:MAG: hypothetical protein JWM31_244, partial [Solirubrobacterales bacterium]|nr:hypothetical protein [Solirubrobacterales bacterium]
MGSMSSTGSEPSAPRPQLLSVATTSVDGHFGIAVAGAVDVAGVDRLRSAADAAIADAAAGLVVLDLSGCT